MEKSVKPTEIFNDKGDLLKIEFHTLEGEFVIEAVWDERDAQSEENHKAFRKWAYNFMRNREYKVVHTSIKGVVK
jgi:hypothetical protein